jgi:diguanylate cyclase
LSIRIATLGNIMLDLHSRYRGIDGQSLARRVVDLLKQHDVSTSPSNYEVWITHAAGVHPDLSRAIDAHLASGSKFTDAVNQALFDRFFSNTRLTVDMVETSETVARELSGVIATLREAGDQTGAYADTLQNAATTIERGVDATDLSGVMASLVAVTREMVANNRQLVTEMASSSRQIEALQTALQNVKVEALTDGLTGLANRRLLDETLRRRVDELDASAGLCLLMCDIDHFKRFNDTWGHPVGDQVIRFIATVLGQHAHGDILAARYGGEEFALVFPRTHLAKASAIGEAIRQEIGSKRLTRRSTGQVIGAVTISIGVAQLRRHETVADLIGRADACLYASKRAGRDRITTDADAALVSAA